MPRERVTSRQPWAWVPTLYFAEGIPYVVVMTVSVIMYKKLGISREASVEEIRNAYRKLAVRYHPDKISRFDKLLRDRAIEEMKRINYAREVLLDNDRRALYDATLPPVKPIEFED